MENKETLKLAAVRYAENTPDNDPVRILSFIYGAKWQTERMYSEEDLRKAILTSFLLGVDRGIYSKETEDKIIEQFKKK
jgi:hypothetical protein